MTNATTMQALFACAMVEGCSLSVARKILGFSTDDLMDAVMFRLAASEVESQDGITYYEPDYQKTIVESFKRLEKMN